MNYVILGAIAIEALFFAYKYKQYKQIEKLNIQDPANLDRFVTSAYGQIVLPGINSYPTVEQAVVGTLGAQSRAHIQ